MGDKIKVLITVKTYPLPSLKYKELVCTAGVREDGSFIRLYPIDYRYKPYWQWYSKYQWIEIEVEKNQKDPRSESYKLVEEAQIRPLGKPIKAWEERKAYVLKKGAQTMCWLRALPLYQCSLGIIKPKQVTNLTVTEDTKTWKPEWQKLFDQQELFGPKRKPLEKIPYKYSYVFTCEEPGCKGHKMKIEDWEIYQLFRKMRDTHQNEETANQKVKEKFFDEVCSPKRDTHFFVGTMRKYPRSWIILGTFWPNKKDPEFPF